MSLFTKAVIANWARIKKGQDNFRFTPNTDRKQEARWDKKADALVLTDDEIRKKNFARDYKSTTFKDVDW